MFEIIQRGFQFLSVYKKHPRYMRNLLRQKFLLQKRRRVLKKNRLNVKSPPPLVYKFLLTDRCNLNCKMCWLWGENGILDRQGENEIDYKIVESVIDQVKDKKPQFIFSGGEPLLYSRYDDLLRKIRDCGCFMITCTNGMLLDKYIPLIDGNPYASFLISLDGLKEETDSLRGDGVFEKVVENIKKLKNLDEPPYIGIQFTLRPENVHILSDFCVEMIELGVDWILINPCWFLTKNQARDYEVCLMEKWGTTAKRHRGYVMDYDLDVEEFKKQYLKIKGENFPIQISCYLKKPADDINNYVLDDGFNMNGLCFKNWIRMDVNSRGFVSPCIQFDDINFDNLGGKTVDEVWNSPKYMDFRGYLRDNLLPVCNKCNNLYLYDLERMVL